MELFEALLLEVAVCDHSLGRTLSCWPEYHVTSTWNVPSSGSSSMLWMMLVRGEELLALSRCHSDLPSRSGGMGRPGVDIRILSKLVPQID